MVKNNKPVWSIQPHDSVDKHFEIYGPLDLVLKVDYDDVNHDQVDADTELLVAFLNEQWPRRE